MISVPKLALAVALAGGAHIALAQPIAVAPAPYAFDPNDPAARLADNLVILSQNPRDLNALIGAGQSAVAVGDGNAALAFLARAEEISPRNGRIKAALGSALVLLERPGEALKLFSEASALGVPDADIAADRGLAHDLKGEPRKAQRDYMIARGFAPSDELTRRMALSYGISGDKANALALLDPLLRKQDQAAWRARAFIFAMAGDMREATDIARQVMPPGVGDSMTPFLQRLASLKPADRAMAVNFGTMPGDGTRLASAPVLPSSGGSTSAGLIPAGDPLGPRVEDAPVRTAALATSREPRRRPGATDAATPQPGFVGSGRPTVTPEQVAAVTGVPLTPGRIEKRIEKRLAPVDPERLPPEVRPALTEPAEPMPAGVKLATAPTLASPPPSGVIAQSTSAPPKPAALPSAPVTPAAAIAPVLAASVSAPGVIEQSPSPSPAGQSQVTAALFEIGPEPVKAAPTPSVAGVIPPLPVAKPAGEIATAPPAPVTAPAIQTVPVPDRVAVAPPSPSVIVGSAPPPSGVIADVAPQQPVVAPAPVATETATLVSPAPVTPAPSSPVGDGAQAIASFAKPTAPPVVAPVVDAAPAPSPEGGLAAIIAAIEPEAESAAGPLPTAAEIRAARLAQQKKAAAQAKAEADAKAEKDAKEAEKREAAKHPARVWVQVATGANESALPSTWRRMRDKAPTVFKGLSAASVPFKSTNRLLVGPFKSQSEARSLVNAMQKAGLSGTTYSSEAGQEIARLASK